MWKSITLHISGPISISALPRVSIAFNILVCNCFDRFPGMIVKKVWKNLTYLSQIVATIVYFYSCDFVKKEEKKCAEHPQEENANVRLETQPSAENDAPATIMDTTPEKPSEIAN